MVWYGPLNARMFSKNSSGPTFKCKTPLKFQWKKFSLFRSLPFWYAANRRSVRQHRGNSSIQDGDYSSTRFDTQYGWEGEPGESSKYYVQGGPTFLSRDGAEDLEYQVGGKVGIKTKLTEDVIVTVKGLQWWWLGPQWC